MRYLWVEDFDGGKSGQKEIRDKLEKYFQLENKCINICTLEDTLRFLDEPENWKKFDVILIDIRFRVCSTTDDEKEIYKHYFASFLTEDKFKDYTNRIGGDINSASSGILLYLALIHKYNFNQERIAFVSANIDDSSNQIPEIDKMREYICKAEFTALTKDDIYWFDDLNDRLYDKFINKTEYAIPETADINWNDIGKLEEQINEVEVKLKKNQQNQNQQNQNQQNQNLTELKYNSIKKQFENVGLKLPLAFEKPTDDRFDRSWKFQRWIKKLYSNDYYKLRATILPICITIKETIGTKGTKKLKYCDLRMHYNKAGERKEEEKDEMIKCMLDELIESFPENILNKRKITYVYKRIIRTSVSLCDEIDPETDKKSKENASRAVLKIVRNWMSHQGIKNISSGDVAFVLYAMVLTFMGEEYASDIKKILIDIDNNITENVDYSDEKIHEEIRNMEKVAKKRHHDAYEDYKKTVGDCCAKKNKKYFDKEDADIYMIISAIGNQYSKLRDEVSMDYIYLLYLGMIDEYEKLEISILNKLKKNKFFET